MSIVRDNLMNREGYAPYCGNVDGCFMPRAYWAGRQFRCHACGWESAFTDEFIAEYKAKWGLK